jgi:hypothetical protein
MIDREVRRVVYEMTMRAGAPPLIADIAQVLNVPAVDVAASLQRLAEGHILVLQRDSGEILMAAPYSAVPTPFVVHAAGVRAFGNCIWDALGIAAMLHADAEIRTSCGDCGSAALLRVADEQVIGEGLVHFALPVRQWWNDVVFT